MSLVFLVLSLITDIVITLVWMLELILGCWRSYLDIINSFLLLFQVILDLLLFELLLDGILGFLELSHVLNFTTRQLISIVEFEFLNADL